MEILKIIEKLQIYSEYFIANKMNGGFANAVTEAVSLLISQGEQIADLQNELLDERYRHDRYVDFELAEAEELRKAREAQRWIPVTEKLPDRTMQCVCRYVYGDDVVFPFYQALWYFIDSNKPHFQHEGHMRLRVTHWMPLPEPPKEEYNE
jgi:hypothetical protein